MSSKTQEIAESIKSERIYRNIMNKNEFDDDDDDKKDEEIVINALKRMKKKGKNIKEFMWKTMSELCYKNDYQIDNKFDDEKKNNNNNYSIENDENQLSQLIDIKEK
eukprot:10096_1